MKLFQYFQKIHVQPQTTKYNGNGMKILRSILTNNNFRRGDEGPYVCMPTISSSRKSTSLTRSDAQEENQIGECDVNLYICTRHVL